MADTSSGWIKVYRCINQNWMMRDHAALALWIYLLTNATHQPYKVTFRGQLIELMPGQITCGRNQLASVLGISPSKVERTLQRLKSEHQIERQTDNRCSLITITKWCDFQVTGQQNGQQTDSHRTTGGQQADTKQEHKNNRIEEGGAPFVEPSIATGVPTLEQVMESVFKRIPEFFPEHHEAGRAEIKAAEFRRAIRNAYNEMNCSADAYGRWRWGNRLVVDWRNPIRTKLNEADAEMMKAFRARRGQPI